jgi:hypothetical protein
MNLKNLKTAEVIEVTSEARLSLMSDYRNSRITEVVYLKKMATLSNLEVAALKASIR